MILALSTAFAFWSLAVFARYGAVVVTDSVIMIRNMIFCRVIPLKEVETFCWGSAINELSILEQAKSPNLQTYALLEGGNHQVMSGMQATRVTRSKDVVQHSLDQMNASLNHKRQNLP